MLTSMSVLVILARKYVRWPRRVLSRGELL